MTVAVARRFHFRAAHRLDKVGPPWNRLHEHLYVVEVVCEGPRGEDGLIVDTERLDEAWDDFEDPIEREGFNLNRATGTDTSVESLAVYWLDLFREAVPQVTEVTVWEDDCRWGRARA